MANKYPFDGKDIKNQTLPGQQRNTQESRPSSDLIPVVNQTEVVKKFLGASLDPMISKGNLEEVNAYVGVSKGGLTRPTIDYYLSSNDSAKEQYRFVPGVSTQSKQSDTLGEIVDAVPYYDLWRKLESQEVNLTNKSDWIDKSWGFAPPINPDKFANFTNYYWIVTDLPAIQIEGNINLDEVQQGPYYTTPIQPNGKRLELRNGMRLVFKNLGNGVVTPSSYVSTTETVYWIVSGVGNKIKLLNSSYINTEIPYVLGEKEYIVIERGAEDRNAWSRTNKWYHYMSVYETCRFLGISTKTVINFGNKGSRPIIEFDKDMVLWNHGIDYKYKVDFVSDNFSNIVDLTGLTELDIDGQPVQEGDTVLFRQGDASVKNKIYTVTGVGTGLVWTQTGTSAHNEIVIANKGVTYKWHTLHFDSVTEEWKLSQQKTTRGQAPKFAIFDLDGNAIETYSNVAYDGSYVFGYQHGTTFDSQLNFNVSVSYNQTKTIIQGFENLVFKNYLDDPLTATINGARKNIPGPYFYKRITLALEGVRAYQLDGAWQLANHQRLATKEINVPITDEIIDTKIVPIGNTINLFGYNYQITVEKDRSLRELDPMGESVAPKLIFWQKDLSSRWREWPEALLLAKGKPNNIFSFADDIEIYDQAGNLVTDGRVTYGVDTFNPTRTKITINLNANETDTQWTLKHLSTGLEYKMLIVFYSYDSRRPKVYKNGLELDPYYEFKVNSNGLELIGDGATLLKSDQIDVRLYGADTTAIEVPIANLEKNPTNQSVILSTFDQLFLHFQTQIESQTFISRFDLPKLIGPSGLGQSLGLNDYDHVYKQRVAGTKILKHNASAPRAMLSVFDDVINPSNIMRTSSAAYSVFIDKILRKTVELETTQDLESMTAAEILDQILTSINQGKNTTFPYAYSEMVHYGTPKAQRTVTGVTGSIALPAVVDSTDPLADHVYVYADGVQLVRGVDYTLTDTSVELLGAFVPEIEISVKIYASGDACYVPPTPAKLGLMPLYMPEIVNDPYHNDTIQLIRRHDGGKIPLFDDHRDRVLLEYELRVYNNALPELRQNNNIDICSYLPGYSRSNGVYFTRLVAFLDNAFRKWANDNGITSLTNLEYDPSDSFTWNYSDEVGSPDYRIGHWRNIYINRFDTERPHSHPWEMLGFTVKPTWWDTHYSWTNPTKRTALENALVNGLITEPGAEPIYNWIVARVGPFPVDNNSELLSPFQAGMYAEPAPESASADWVFGDGGAQEQAWIMSPRYSFAVAEFLCLNFGPQFIDYRWNGFLVKEASSYAMNLDYLTNDWTNYQTDVIHRVDNKRILGYGHLVSEILQQLGASLTTQLSDRVTTLGPRLMLPVEGFTDKRVMRVLADTLVEQDRGNFVPEENYQVVRYRSSPVDVLYYSGVKCTIDASGGYRIEGFNKEYPYFLYLTPRTNQRINISVGDFVAKEPINFNTDPTTFQYGTVLTTKQDVYDFIIGYGKYLESKGWEFQDLDSNLGQIKDWRFVATQFVEWSNTRWDTGTSINLSPGSNKLILNHRYHEVKNLRDQLFEEYPVVDYKGKGIEANVLKVNRLVARTEILCPPTTGIFGLKIQLVDYDHLMVFDQQTIFGDNILDTLYNQKLLRVKLIGKRTNGWNGQAISLGYLPEKSGLLANFETVVGQVLDEYNSIEEGILNSALQKISALNIGVYDKEYLTNLLYTPSVIFEFQRGLLKKKGTPAAYDRLRRSDAVDVQGRESEISLREEWMFSIGEFGGNQNFRWELQVKSSDQKLNPQVYRITPEFVPDTRYTVFRDQLADTIIDLPPNDSRWVERPSPGQLFPLREDNQEGDLLVAGLSMINEIDYTVNNLDDLPSLAEYDNPQDLFQAFYDIPSWTATTSFVIGDKCRYDGKVYISNANILGAESNTFQTTQWSLGVEPKLPAVWIGITKANNQDINNWQVMQLMDFELPIESICLGINSGDDAEITLPEGKLHNLSEGDYVFIAGADGLASIDGIHKVTNVINSRKFRVDEYVPGCSYTGKLFVFRPVHFTTITELNASLSSIRYNYQDGMKLYLDNGYSNYVVYTYQGDNTPMTPIVVERVRSGRVDPSAIESVIVYDYKKNIPIVNCQLFDPIKGFIPHAASKELNTIQNYDPASYTSSTDADKNTDDDTAWFDEKLGSLWWDLSNTRYLDYEQSDINQRVKYWGKLFPGSEIEVYEWIRTTVAPYDYNNAVANNTVENGQLLTGTARQEFGTEEGVYNWSQREELNADGSTATYYYYWVKNKEQVPMVPGRTISARSVADIITDPTSNGIPWFAAVAPDAFIVANIGSAIDDKNTSLQIKFKDPTQPDHKQWLLIKENDANAVVPDWLHFRLRDSLLGFDQRIETYNVTDYDTGTYYVKDDVVKYSGVYWRAFRDFQQADVFYTDGSPVNFASQPWVRLYDFLVVNDQTITQVQGKDVPDARLHPFVKYGNRIRPRQQTWIKNRWLAIKNFIEVANRLLLTIPVVLTVENWDRRLGVTNLISGLKTYDVTESWTYADWSNVDFDYASAEIDVEYTSTQDLFADTTQPNNTLGRVTLPDGNIEVFKFIDNVWQLLYATNGTIQISKLLFDFEASGTGWDSSPWDSTTWDPAPLHLLFELIQALREDIFIDANEGLYADLFFGMVHYIHSENPLVDWIVKSTYLTLLNKDSRGLDQEAYYRKSIVDELVDYVKDVKPYHSKLREILDQREVVDLADLTITDSNTKKIIMRYSRHGDPEFRGEYVDGKPFWWLEPGWDRQPWDFSVEVDNPPYPHEPGTVHPTINKVWSWDMRRPDLEALIDTIYNGYSFGTPAELYDSIVEGNKFIQPEWEGYPQELVPLYPGETVEIRVQTNANGSIVDANTLSFRYFKDILGSVEVTRIANDHKTTLAAEITSTSTEIELVDGSILSEIDKARGRPGVIWIGAERIEFWTRNGNMLSDIIRGTLGTPILDHNIGDTVYDGGAINIVPGPTELSNWGNTLYPAWSALGSKMHDGGNIQAEFLLAKPGNFA